MSRRGQKPAKRTSLHPDFFAAINAHGQLGALATIGGFPFRTRFSYCLHNSFPINDENLARFTRIASFINYTGDVFKVAL